MINALLLSIYMRNKINTHILYILMISYSLRCTSCSRTAQLWRCFRCMTPHLPKPTTGKNGRGASHTSAREGRACGGLFTLTPGDEADSCLNAPLFFSRASVLLWWDEKTVKASRINMIERKMMRNAWQQGKANLTIFRQLSHGMQL